MKFIYIFRVIMDGCKTLHKQEFGCELPYNQNVLLAQDHYNNININNQPYDFKNNSNVAYIV